MLAIYIAWSCIYSYRKIVATKLFVIRYKLCMGLSIDPSWAVLIKETLEILRIQDFGEDGGSALKALEPKLDIFKNHVFETLHFKVPPFEVQD